MCATLLFHTAKKVSVTGRSEVTPDWKDEGEQWGGRRGGSGMREGEAGSRNSGREQGKNGGHLK